MLPPDQLPVLPPEEPAKEPPDEPPRDPMDPPDPIEPPPIREPTRPSRFRIGCRPPNRPPPELPQLPPEPRPKPPDPPQLPPAALADSGVATVKIATNTNVVQNETRVVCRALKLSLCIVVLIFLARELPEKAMQSHTVLTVWCSLWSHS